MKGTTFVKIAFAKMHGLGNDMIVLDSRDTGFVPSSESSVPIGCTFSNPLISWQL